MHKLKCNLDQFSLGHKQMDQGTGTQHENITILDKKKIIFKYKRPYEVFLDRNGTLSTWYKILLFELV